MDHERLVIRSKTPEGVLRFDEFGFAVFADDQGDVERNHCYTSTQKFLPEQTDVWKSYLETWGESFICSPNKVRYLLRRGVPRELRPLLWAKLLCCEQQRETSSFSYSECVRALRSQLVELGISEYCLRTNQADVWDDDEDGSAKGDGKGRAGPTRMKHLVPLQILRQIVVDLERTFPTHRLFMGSRPEAKEGRASLFRLLCVYAIYNPEVGYCQGMSYLVGMLLMVMKNEQDVFWAMVALFEKPKFLAGYFDNNLKRIQSHAQLFHRLLHQRFPRVARHFDSLGVQPLMYVTPWFMCLYTALPCWDTVLAIWDMILLDGVTTIFRVGLSLIEVNRDAILANKDLTKILPPLLHPKADKVYHEVLMPVVWKTGVEKWEIEALQAIIAEEEDPEKAGMKRRRRAQRLFGEMSPQNKRIKIEEKPKPVTANGGFFQRVVNMFTPRSQRGLEDPPPPPVESSKGRPALGAGRPARTRHRHHAGHNRGPGTARPARCHTNARDKEEHKRGLVSIGNLEEGMSGNTHKRSQGHKQPATSTYPKFQFDTRVLSQDTTSTQAEKVKKVQGDKHQVDDGEAGPTSFVNPRYSSRGNTPRSTGKSKMFGKLHSQIFGTEVMPATSISHPLQDVGEMSTPSPRRRSSGSVRKKRLSGAKMSSPRNRQSSSKGGAVKPVVVARRSGWLSPYCRQFVQTQQAKSKAPQLHSNNASPSRHGNRIRSPESAIRDAALSPCPPSPDIFHAVSPDVVLSPDKENRCQLASPSSTPPILRSASRQASSMESLNSTPDGVLSVLGDYQALSLSEVRSGVKGNTRQTKTSRGKNGEIIFKTPSHHSMNLRPRERTPGRFNLPGTPRTEGRPHVSWQNPLNVPSSRKLVCRSARAEHSFKSFHTPTPLRKSQVIDLYQSPVFSSPEVELVSLGATSPTTALNIGAMQLDDLSPRV